MTRSRLRWIDACRSECSLPPSLPVHRVWFKIPSMPQEGDTRRSFILIDAINPDDGSIYKVQISHERMQAVAKRSLGQASECGYIVLALLLWDAAFRVSAGRIQACGVARPGISGFCEPRTHRL